MFQQEMNSCGTGHEERERKEGTKPVVLHPVNHDLYQGERERDMQSIASTIINRFRSKLIQCYDT